MIIGPVFSQKLDYNKLTRESSRPLAAAQKLTSTRKINSVNQDYRHFYLQRVIWSTWTLFIFIKSKFAFKGTGLGHLIGQIDLKPKPKKFIESLFEN